MEEFIRIGFLTKDSEYLNDLRFLLDAVTVGVECQQNPLSHWWKDSPDELLGKLEKELKRVTNYQTRLADVHDIILQMNNKGEEEDDKIGENNV